MRGQVVATISEELPPDSIMLIYLSASGYLCILIICSMARLVWGGMVFNFHLDKSNFTHLALNSVDCCLKLHNYSICMYSYSGFSDFIPILYEKLDLHPDFVIFRPSPLHVGNL